MPDVQNYVKAFSDITDKDKRNGLDIRRLKTRVENWEPTYFDKDSPLKALGLQFLTTDKSKLVFNTISVLAHIFSIIMIVYLTYKLRQCHVILANLAIIHKIDAYAIPKINQIPTLAPFEPTQFTLYQACIAVATISVALITVIQFTTLMLYYCKCKFPCLGEIYETLCGPNQSLRSNQLYLKIVSNRTNGGIILPLKALAYEVNMLEYCKAPLIDRMHLAVGSLRPSIVIKWNGPVQLRVHGQITEIDLPEKISVPIFLSGIAENIMKTPLRDLTTMILWANKSPDQYEQLPTILDGATGTPHRPKSDNLCPAMATGGHMGIAHVESNPPINNSDSTFPRYHLPPPISFPSEFELPLFDLSDRAAPMEGIVKLPERLASINQTVKYVAPPVAPFSRSTGNLMFKTMKATTSIPSFHDAPKKRRYTFKEGDDSETQSLDLDLDITQMPLDHSIVEFQKI
jgi:hypothetical protein